MTPWDLVGWIIVITLLLGCVFVVIDAARNGSVS